jgi:DNA-binding winged helix-turn-helix (wHTH) protein
MTATAIVKPALLDPTSTVERASYVDRRAVLSFASFRLDLVEERLWKGEQEVHLRPKPFAILRYLAQRPRRVVTHSEIVEAVWGGAVAMSESLLRTHMHDLRRALGEAVIETVNGRGYRFMALPAAGDHGPARCSARAVKQLTDALAAMGVNAAVTIVVGDPQSTRLRLTTSTESEDAAPAP